MKKYKIIISLLLLTLLAQFDAYGQLTENRRRNETERSDSGIYGRLMELMTAFLPSSETMSTWSDPSVQLPTPSIENRSKSGGRNPFIPLTAERTTKNDVNAELAVSKTAQAEAESYLAIRLTATLISTGLRWSKPTVIIEESGISRFISVGDTIAGMTIVEIQRGKVILNKGGKKCVMTLGLLPKEAVTNES